METNNNVMEIVPFTLPQNTEDYSTIENVSSSKPGNSFIQMDQ